MKNEYVENDQINAIIDGIYQEMYKKTDRGAKNGEILLKLTCPSELEPDDLSNQIQQYFSEIFVYPSKTVKKYFIHVEQNGMDVKIDLKWGYHAIIANANAKA